MLLTSSEMPMPLDGMEAARVLPEYHSITAWAEHAPFAFWLAATLRPRIYVELGSHYGFSYFAFCQKFAELKSDTRCFAVDTWMGDEHASHYGEEVYQAVQQHNQRYAEFSTLLRSTFDEALVHFENKSVDLLHVDGRHFYDDVKHDFESWIPKLTDDAVVLFHDTTVRERNFGVWKLFGELKKRHSTFEFTHCHGLGVLAIGKIPHSLEPLFSANSDDRNAIQRAFAELGKTSSGRLNEQTEAAARQSLKISDVPAGVLTEDQIAAWPIEINEIIATISRQHYLARKKRTRKDKIRSRVKAALQPKLHEIDLVQSSPLFDADWYRRTYRDVADSNFDPCLHYVRHGAGEGRNPGPLFSTLAYLRNNPDVVVSKQNALAHFVEFGWRQRRSVFRDAFNEFSKSDLPAIQAHISSLPTRPVISVLMPVYNPNVEHLRLAIASVVSQAYPHWQLCIANDASTNPEIGPVLDDFASSDPRIEVVHREKNGNISAASNTALQLASGEYIALLDHDDLLHETALYEVAVEINAHRDADLIYTDEDRVDENGIHSKPYFKSDFNPELFLSQNMICHLSVYRRSLVEAIGGFRVGLEGSQDYDLALRIWAASKSDRIRHIPAVLYHWRNASNTQSYSKSNLDRCTASAVRAIQDFLDQEGEGATVAAAPNQPNCTRIVRKLGTPPPLVSIIVPTKDRADLLRRCARGILETTRYQNIELIIIDHESKSSTARALLAELARDGRVRILPFTGPFNYSKMNNFAVQQAKGVILCLLNDDTEVLDSDWLNEMVANAIRPEVGAVGAKLLFPDRTIQHAGVIVGLGGVAGHSLLKAKQKGPKYFGHPNLTRAMSAVTAACLVVRKSVYLEVGGLNEVDLQIAFNDIELCLKIQSAGYRNVWTPYATLVHHESASRGTDDTSEKLARFQQEFAYMRRTWGTTIKNDPFYNPNLTLETHFYETAAKKRRRNPWHEYEQQSLTG